MMNKIKGILIATLLITGFCVCSYIEHNYTRNDCLVYEIDERTAFITDKCGYSWEWEMSTDDELKVDDVVNLKMNDNCTTSYVDDDIITKVVKVNK